MIRLTALALVLCFLCGCAGFRDKFQKWHGIGKYEVEEAK